MSTAEDELEIGKPILRSAALQSRAASEKLTPEQIRGLQDCVAEFKDNYLVIRPKDITKPGAISIERLESYNALREKLTSKEAEGKELKCEGKKYCHDGLGGSYENNNTGLFYDSKLTGGIEALANWDVSEVTSMWALFRSSNFKGDLTPLAKWDTSNVTNMGAMFESSQLKGDLIPLANWKTDNVQNMWSMFHDSRLIGDLTPLAKWNTSRVTDMTGAFWNSKFKGTLEPLRNWDTSQVTRIGGMFRDSRFTGDLTPLANWDTSKVTRMGRMFNDSRFIGDFRSLANWDLSKVGHINQMFDNVGDTKTLLILNGLDFANSGDKRYGFRGFKGVVVANGWTNVDDSVIDDLHDFNNATMLLVTDNATILEKQKSNNYNYSIPIELMYKGQAHKVYIPAIYDSKGSNDAMSVVGPIIKKKIEEKIAELKKTHPELIDGYIALPTRAMTDGEKAVETPLYFVQSYELKKKEPEGFQVSYDQYRITTPSPVQIEFDETKTVNESYISQKGQLGEEIRYDKVTSMSGYEIERKEDETKRKVIRQATPTIIKIGTKNSQLAVTETTENDDNIIIHLSDNSTVTVPKGKQGLKGADGTPGKSAYEIWKADQKAKNPALTDAELTEEKFLESLKGKDGLSSKVTKETNPDTGVTTITIVQDVLKNGKVEKEKSKITIENGKSITDAKVNDKGHLIVTIGKDDDAKTVDAGEVIGKDGKTPQIIVGDKVNGVTKITIKGYDENSKQLEDKVIEIKDGITYVPVLDKKDDVATIKFYPAKPGTTEADENAQPIGNEIKIYDGLSPLVNAGRNKTDDGLTLTITTLTRNGEGKVVKTPKEFNIKDGENGITPEIMACREKDKNGRTGIAIYARYPKKEGQLLPEARAALLSSDDEFYDTPPTLDHMLPPMAMSFRSVMPDSEDEWHQSSAKSDSQVNQDRDKKSSLGGQINTRHEQSERDRKGNSTRSVDDKSNTSVSLITQPKTKSKVNESDLTSPARREKEVTEISNALKKQRGTQTTDSTALVESKKGIANSDYLTRESKKVNADTYSLIRETKKDADTHSLEKKTKKVNADTRSLTKETKKVTTADNSLEKKVSQAKDSSVDKMYQLWKENPENKEKSINEFVTEIEEGQRPVGSVQVAKLATGSPHVCTSKHLPSTGSAFGFASFAGMSLLLVGAGMAKKKAETEQ